MEMERTHILRHFSNQQLKQRVTSNKQKTFRQQMSGCHDAVMSSHKQQIHILLIHSPFTVFFWTGYFWLQCLIFYIHLSI